jgi:hypothetical protein
VLTEKCPFAWEVAKIAGRPAKSCWWLNAFEVNVTWDPGAHPPAADPDTVTVPPAGTEAGETLMEAAAAGPALASSTSAAIAPARRAHQPQALGVVAV